MARPTKFSKARSEQILKAIKAGATRDVAARGAGVSSSTLYSWLEQGRSKDSGQLSDFAEAVDAADAEAEISLIVCMRKEAANGDWRAAHALLQCRYPKRWAKPRSEERGERERDAAPAIDLKALTKKELELLEKLYER